MNAAKLKLQAVLVAFSELRKAIADGEDGMGRSPLSPAEAANIVAWRLEELEGLVGCETPANLFDLPATR